ncbi:MAG: 6-hydroxymethylpterin diphosphokinase MptE-like protein, partial [Nitrospinota bacterium]
ETILVMSPVTYPALPQIFQGTLLLMGYNIPLMNWIERLTGPFGEMLVGGSVSTSAYDFARKLGCNPVVLCGQDLSYEFSRGYVSGSLYSSIFEKDLKHNNNMESLQGDHVALFGTLTGKNIFGGPVLSNEEMLSWKNWYEAVSASGSTINSTEGGLDIGGFTIQPLKKTVALSFSQEFPIKKIISDSLAKKREFDISKLLSNLGEYGNSLGTVIDLARQGLKCCSELSRSSLKKLSEEGTGNRFGHLHILSSSIMAETTFLETNQWEIDILLDKLSKTEGNGEGSIKTKLAGYKELFKGVLEISQTRNNDLQEGINKFSSCTSKSG